MTTALVILLVYVSNLYYKLPNVHQSTQNPLPAEGMGLGARTVDRPDGGKAALAPWIRPCVVP